MKAKTLTTLSLMAQKMGITEDIIQLEVDGSDRKANEEVAKRLLAIVINNLWKVEEELTTLIMLEKGITKEEAENYDVVSFIKELLTNNNIKAFF